MPPRDHTASHTVSAVSPPIEPIPRSGYHRATVDTYIDIKLGILGDVSLHKRTTHNTKFLDMLYYIWKCCKQKSHVRQGPCTNNLHSPDISSMCSRGANTPHLSQVESTYHARMRCSLHDSFIHRLDSISRLRANRRFWQQACSINS